MDTGDMHYGTTKLSIDEKGRIAIPARHRSALLESCHGRLTITRSTDRCLQIFPEPAWQVFAEKLLGLPPLDPRAKRLQRLFLGAAEEVVMDKQGRVPISPFLREQAGLDRSAYIVGQGKNFELWDAATFDGYNEQEEFDAEYLASIQFQF